MAVFNDSLSIATLHLFILTTPIVFCSFIRNCDSSLLLSLRLFFIIIGILQLSLIIV